jgi:hypothetical protein
MSAINLARLYKRAAQEEASLRGDTMVDMEELDHLHNPPTPTPTPEPDPDPMWEPGCYVPGEMILLPHANTEEKYFSR